MEEKGGRNSWVRKSYLVQDILLFLLKNAVLHFLHGLYPDSIAINENI